MRWEDERYVRVYTRDTPEWLCLSFLAQGLFCLLLRKVDRAGVLPLGKVGRRGVAVAVGHAHQWPMLEPALDELLEDGCVVISGDRLVIRNFIEAQEAQASDKARARKHRENVRAGVTGGSQGVAERHAQPESRDAGVTERDAPVTIRNETVTPSLAVPIRAEPCRTEEEDPPCASQPDDRGVVRLAGDGQGLGHFRGLLAKRLGVGRVIVGKDPADVIRFFQAQLATVGEEELLADCVEAAKRSTTGKPSSLSWFKGWLDRLPMPSPGARQ